MAHSKLDCWQAVSFFIFVMVLTEICCKSALNLSISYQMTVTGGPLHYYPSVFNYSVLCPTNGQHLVKRTGKCAFSSCDWQELIGKFFAV